MEVYDVCLHVGNGGEWLGDFYLKTKKKLEDKGLSVVLYTDVVEVKAFFDKNEVNSYIFLEKYDGKVDVDFVMNAITELGFNPKSLYNSEQKFYDIEEKDCIAYFARYVHSVLKLKNIKKAKVYVTYEGDEIDHNIFRILGRLNGGKSLYWGISNLDTRTHFHDDEKRYFNTPAENQGVIPEEELLWLRNYIESYTKKKTNLWGDPKREDIKFKLSYFGSAFKKVWNKISNQDNDPRRTFGHALKRYTKRLLRRQYAYLKYNNNFSFNENLDYYYFPLHVPFDSQLTQRGLPFYDQVSLVQTISNYLPYSSRLIVKEHPMGRGYYSVSDLNKLGKLSNVILLPAYSNSHDIVPKAKGIFVINSSVGYEGLMYKKPVVTFGRSFFREQGLTIDIDSLYELETVFDRIKKHEVIDNKVYDFLWRVKKNSFPVDLYFINEDNYNGKIDEYVKALEFEVRKKI